MLAAIIDNNKGGKAMAEGAGLSSMGVSYLELLSLSRFKAFWDPRLLGTELLEGISTDTRSLEPGDLFVALKGENFNGEDFAFSALEKGAKAAIVSLEFYQSRKDSGKLNANRLIGVEDTLFSLGELARTLRIKSKAKVIAITGSVAKTTVKELIYSIFSCQYPGGVVGTTGNFNNLIGLPLSVFKLGSDTTHLILEMGANHFGEIARLTQIAEPDLGIITKVERAHLEFFGDKNGVARAKGELFLGMEKIDSIKVLNVSDPFLKGMEIGIGRRFTFGQGAVGADLRLVKRGQLPDGQELFFESDYLEGGSLKVTSSLLGYHNGENILAACAAALAYGVSQEAILKGVAEVEPLNGRGKTFEQDGIYIIDDSYNANPGSMEGALMALMERPGTQKSAVLGDMLELGEKSPKYHLDLGRRCAAYGIKNLYLTGDYAGYVEEGALEGGMEKEQVFIFDEGGEAIRKALQKGSRGEFLLIKGSHGSGLGAHLQQILKAKNAL
ncbi:MAG: UDP-N-acetylmuramoyl-tripeptide--D-alanyl-D-alanine ligase [Deltaproteobacteria bacterium]|jgi:UDP-N-acetylmuramoyl-tripeptide--D-alanyl-D-alanine ligase|nr:UDP-N-acetylmuramoyl-tripeptide--D-alanyl-D-alanine ligase [Deltaproteobacteria bacterium]